MGEIRAEQLGEKPQQLAYFGRPLFGCNNRIETQETKQLPIYHDGLNQNRLDVLGNQRGSFGLPGIRKVLHLTDVNLLPLFQCLDPLRECRTRQALQLVLLTGYAWRTPFIGIRYPPMSFALENIGTIGTAGDSKRCKNVLQQLRHP